MRRILVGIKRVVDYSVRVRVKPDGTGVALDGVKMSINPFDEIALEEALRIKERGEADEVVVISIGTEEAQQQLRTALAMGADRALLVKSDAAVDPLTAAQVFTAIAKAEDARMVIVGKQAIDDDANQTGQMLAALWDRRRHAARDARSGRRSRDPRSRPAGGHHRRLAPERTALREVAGHHEGQEEAARHQVVCRLRRGSYATFAGDALRGAGNAQQGHCGQGCRGTR